MELVKGNIFGFYALIVASLVVVIVVWVAKRGTFIPTLRRIAGLDAMEEAIGRATEMGRPVHFSPGIADITGDTVP
ncbi:MAG: hypothetical protein KGZ66_01795, partial [Selenomonadales bacterium]|nr:hypothetical protein [Selenomonadales bacterium]